MSTELFIYLSIYLSIYLPTYLSTTKDEDENDISVIESESSKIGFKPTPG